MGRKPRTAPFDTPSQTVRVEPIVEPEPPVSVSVSGHVPPPGEREVDGDEPLEPPA